MTVFFFLFQDLTWLQGPGGGGELAAVLRAVPTSAEGAEMQEMCTNSLHLLPRNCINHLVCIYMGLLFSHVHLAEFNFLPLPSVTEFLSNHRPLVFLFV